MNVEVKKTRTKKTKIGVIGISKYSDAEVIKKKLNKVSIIKDIEDEANLEFIVSDDSGVCALVRDWCEDKKISCTVIQTAWDLEPKNAGTMRNGDIIKDSSYILFFTDGKNTYIDSAVETARVKKKDFSSYMLEVKEDSKYYKVDSNNRPSTEKIVKQKI